MLLLEPRKHDVTIKRYFSFIVAGSSETCRNRHPLREQNWAAKRTENPQFAEKRCQLREKPSLHNYPNEQLKTPAEQLSKTTFFLNIKLALIVDSISSIVWLHFIDLHFCVQSNFSRKMAPTRKKKHQHKKQLSQLNKI